MLNEVSISIPLETIDIPSLLNYIKGLEANYNQRINELETNYKNLQFEKEVLQEKYDLLIYKRFANSAEKMLAEEKQPRLFNTEEASAETAQEITDNEIEVIKSYKRKKNPGCGRKAIDPKIPRREKILDIAETEKTCACGTRLTKIGEESNEKLHIEPPVIYAEKTIRPKYACRHCEGTEDEATPAVRIAPVEPSIIPKGIASPSLLSTIIIQKFEDHLPFYRQEQQFQRIMVRISRQDMSNWQQQVYEKLKPLFVLLIVTLKSGPVMQMDETVVQVMGEITINKKGEEEKRSDTAESRMWLARGGPPGKTVVLYQYRQTRAAEHAKEILEGYSGYLQTDGYIGYDSALKDNNDIIHVGCWAHTRRKIFEAVKVSARAATAKEGIQYIKKLYVIESQLRQKYKQDEKDSEEQAAQKRELFLSERKEQVVPVFNEFKEWLTKLKDEVPPKTLLGEAVGYSLNQWDKLIRYIESPYLTLDTNAAESAIRPFAVGRKNWMFAQSPAGADSSCGMYTLIQTAKQNGYAPFQYLKTLFEKAPYATSTEDWKKLLPWNILKS